MYGYIDPADRVHEQKAIRAMEHPQPPAEPAWFYMPPPQVHYGPLDSLEQTIVDAMPQRPGRSLMGEAGIFVFAAFMVLGAIAVLKAGAWVVQAVTRKLGKGSHAAR